MAFRVPPWLAGEWRFLAYLNYTVPAADLQPLLPPGLDVDKYEGESFVSVVAGRCLKPKWRGVPVLSAEGFRRVSLQTYVRRGEAKGVYPLSEIYSLPALATLCGSQSHFGASSAVIDSEIEFNPGAEGGSEGKMRYRWGEGNEVSLETDGLPYPAEMWPYDAFFVDKKLTFRGKQDHVFLCAAERPSWFAWEGKNERLSAQAARALAGDHTGWLGGSPTSSFFVKGGPVSFRKNTVDSRR
jgi:uncharacterized protein